MSQRNMQYIINSIVFRPIIRSVAKYQSFTFNLLLLLTHFWTTQPAFICSKSPIETPEQCVKSVQS